jgi:hypothetical protein
MLSDISQRLKPLTMEETNNLYAKDLTDKVHNGLGYNSGQSNSRGRKIIQKLLELQIEFSK